MSQSAQDLPEGWSILKLGEVLRLVNGYGFKEAQWSSNGLPIIRIQNLKSAQAPFNYYAGDLPSKFMAHKGDLLFAWSGTPGTSFGAHIWKGEDAWINQHIFRVEYPETVFDRDFLRLALEKNVSAYIEQAQGGVGLAHITKAKLVESELLVPPLPEQRRIARSVEKLEGKKAEASDRCKRARRTVARLRQSILAAACSGRLTVDWRKENGHRPAPHLDTKSHRRSKQFTPINSYDLDELPDGWIWVQVDDLLPKGGIFDGPFGSNLKTSDYTDVGARVVRLENIGHLHFIGEKHTYVSLEKYRQLVKHEVGPGDIMFSSFVDDEMRVCVLPPDVGTPTIAKADCFTLRPTDKVDRDYLALQLASPSTFKALSNDIHGATRPRVNTTQVRSVPVALCSIEEQREVVRRYQSAAAIIGAAERRLEAAADRLQLSSQAVLAKAFRGELMPIGAPHESDQEQAPEGTP